MSMFSWIAAASISSYRSYHMWTARSVSCGVCVVLYVEIAATTSSAFSAPTIFRRGKGPAETSMSSSVKTFLACAGFSPLVLFAAAATEPSGAGELCGGGPWQEGGAVWAAIGSAQKNNISMQRNRLRSMSALIASMLLSVRRARKVTEVSMRSFFSLRARLFNAIS